MSTNCFAAVCLLVFGIANQIIDYKHRKRKACEPGCAWQYYSQLAREGSLATPVLDASAAVMSTAERAGKGEQDYSVVFENLKAQPHGGSASGVAQRPKAKTLITLKASKFNLTEDDESDGKA